MNTEMFLMGRPIQIKGTSTGTVADAKGRYNFEQLNFLDTFVSYT